MHPQLIDKKFATHKTHYVLQSLLSLLFVFILLISLKYFTHEDLLGIIGTTSLASSAFAVFSAFDIKMTSARNMLGGFFVSILIGILCWELTSLTGVYENDPLFFHELIAALAVGLAMFAMVLFDVQHPPAAGLALGLVIEPWTVATLMVIAIAVISLYLVKITLKRWLINLL